MLRLISLSFFISMATCDPIFTEMDRLVVTPYFGSYSTGTESTWLRISDDHMCYSDEDKTRDGITNRGEILCYEYNGTNYEYLETLTSPNDHVSNQQYYGRDFDIRGDIMVVSAFRSSDVHAVTRGGLLLYYEYNGTNWDLQQVFHHTSPATDDRIGNVLKMSNTTNTLATFYLEKLWIFTRSGSTWTQRAAFSLSSNIISATVGVSDQYVAVSRGTSEGYTGGRISVYNTDDGGTTWNFLQDITFSDQGTWVQFGDFIDIWGDNLITGIEGYESNTGGVVVYSWNGTSWDDETILQPDPLRDTNSFIGEHAVIEDDEIIVCSSSYKDSVESTNPESNPGFVFRFSFNGTGWENTEQLFLNTNDNLCGAGMDFKNETVVAATNDYETLNVDVVIARATLAGPTAAPTTNPSAAPTTNPTLSPSTAPTNSPSAAPTTSPVVPTPTPTASPITPAPTTNERLIMQALESYFVLDDEDRDNITSQVFPLLESTFNPVLPATIDGTIVVVESGVITQELIDIVGNNTLLFDALSTVRCGSGKEYCSVSLAGDSRRRLETQVIIELTFTVTTGDYSSINGVVFNDTDFEQQLVDLMDELNTLEDANIIFGNGGTTSFTVDINLLASSEPSDESFITMGYEVQANLTSVVQNLLNDFNNTSNYIIDTDIVLCPTERNCNYAGTCDPNTGICDCVFTSGSWWWGIDCEVECDCNYDRQCRNAICHCVFPEYGLRCQLNRTDCVDQCFD